MASELGLPPGLNDNFYEIAGPFLYGGMVSALLLGALVVQTVVYFSRASGDRMIYKIAVIALLCSSLAVVGATIFLQNDALITNYGNVAALHAWSVAVFVPLAGPTFSAFVSQGLFGWRIFSLSARSKWVGAGILFLLGVNAVSGLVAIIIEARGGGPVPINANDLLLFVPLVGEEARTSFFRTIAVNEIFLFISAATDMLLTGCLTALLLNRRKKSTELSRDTNSLIWRVVSLSVMTGAITSFYSITVALLVLLTIRKNNIAMAFVLPLVHIYGNVCLTSLNLRRSMNPGHKGSSNLSRSLNTAPSKMQTQMSTVVSEKPYGVPPYAFPARSFSPGSPKDESRPGTGKSELARSFSNRIQVHSSVEQHVEIPSPEADNSSMPTLSYFAPRPVRSQSSLSSLRSRPNFDFDQGRTPPMPVHGVLPSSTSPSEAYPPRRGGGGYF